MRGPRARALIARRLARTLLALAAGAIPVGCGGASDGPPPERPDVLLVTLDTTRADALGAYGSPFPTPTVDGLAERGLVFERAHTVAPLTLPAHASILTGLYPPRHGLRDNGFGPLSADAPLLAVRARAAGYATAAFVGAIVLDERTGLARGFDVYDAPPRPYASEGSHFAERPAAEVCDAALAWLAARDRSRPFFLWVHLFDPHQPYEPPPELATGALAASPYHGEVAYADRELGRVIAALREEGVLEDTLVAVAGDHGEGLGEHGEPSHAVLCYESTLHVPLVLCGPGVPRGRSREVVSLVDLGATLAARFDRATSGPAAASDGRDLLAVPLAPSDGVYFESCAGYLSFGTSPIAGWLDAGAKYVHSSEPTLVDPLRDPAEMHDLSREEPERVARMRTAIADVQARPRLAPGPASPGDGAALRALGYAGLGGQEEELPDPLAPSSRPGHLTGAAAYAETLHALALANAGRQAEALAIYERLSRENPANLLALDGRATALMGLERWEEAVAPLRELVRRRPDRAGAHYNLGVCLRAIGRDEEAVAALWEAARRDPSEKLFMDELMRLLLDAGRREEAQAFAARWEALGGEPRAR